MQNFRFWVKNWNSKKHVKIHSEKSFRLVLLKKNRSKDSKYSRNESYFKNRPSCKGYSPCKIVTLSSKIKIPKNMSKSVLQIIYSCSVQKTAQKKEIFEKWEHFENRPSCKGYSPCKILTLAQKLKFQKPCENPFYKSFTVVLCKKPLKKKEIFEK